MPSRVAVKVFNTGANLKVGMPDPHWQIIARSDNRNWNPRPAVVSEPKDTSWQANNASRSQWISLAAGGAMQPNRVTYTFRTTFDLTGTRPATAVVRGRFIVDNHIKAIRINGRQVQVPSHEYEEFDAWCPFTITRGFIEGVNVLEFEVENGLPHDDIPVTFMGLLVELDGSVLLSWPGAPADNTGATQEQSKN